MKTITTVDELDAMSDRAVIKAADEAILFCIGSGQPDWDGNVWQDEESRWLGSSDVELPATLIHPLVFDAAWGQPIRELCEAAIKRANDPLAARGLYGEAFPATVYAQDILDLLEGGAEDK